MPIPPYQAVMLPTLRLLGDQQEHVPRDVIEGLATEFKLTQQDRATALSSGEPVFNSRVHWGVTYLAHAGLVERPRRGVWKITDAGTALLDTHPTHIDNGTLRQYPSFSEWVRSARRPDTDPSVRTNGDAEGPTETPTETLERLTRQLRSDCADQLLESIAANSPAFFESLVVRVLVAMGYGGNAEEARAQVTGRTGDEGIDGVINEDRLGLDRIYLQAKRWRDVVGRPLVQAFVGSLEGHRAQKGIFITTSRFTPDALTYATHVGKQLVLIDGAQLAGLMIEYGVGVTVSSTFVVPRVDVAFFEEG